VRNQGFLKALGYLWLILIFQFVFYVIFVAVTDISNRGHNTNYVLASYYCILSIKVLKSSCSKKKVLKSQQHLKFQNTTASNSTDTNRYTRF